MSLNDLCGYYDSYERNIVKEFYIPLFNSASNVNRVSCYFSSKALALYARGLENFARTPGSKYRLIVSEDIDKDDFEAVIKGEMQFESYDEMFTDRLREELSLEQKDSLEVLMDLVSSGVVEIKIALVRKGLFHYKWAYVEGIDGERMLMLGSNNETAAAIEENYESFDFREYNENDRFKDNFETMWHDNKPGMIVKSPSELVWKELRKFSKSKHKVISEKSHTNDCLFLDLVDGCLVLENRLNESPSNYSIVYKSDIKRYVYSFEDSILFRDNLDYVEYKKIIEGLSNMCFKQNYMFVVSKDLMDYVDSHDLVINKRVSLGLDIKRRDPMIISNFERYRLVVDDMTVRHLHDQQMWDSFFMYSMMKAGNFSVPGSGKTASTLGVLAYLKSNDEVLNMIVVCPLNSFDSWIDEFEKTFGREPVVFDSRRHSGQNALTAFFNEYAAADLVLVNYQSLGKYSEVLRKYLVSRSLLVFDEAHYVKNWNTRRSEFARSVSRDSTRTLILTGTPMPNSYTDMYSLLHILFPNEYGSYFKYDMAMLRKPSQDIIDDINAKMQPFYCRTSKKDLGVPPENPDIHIHVQSTDEENELFRRVFEACKDNPLTLIIRLLQAESDPTMLMVDEVPEEMMGLFGDDFVEMDVGKSQRLIPSLKGLESSIASIGKTSKMDRCLDLAEQLVSEGKTLIIWCIFRKSIEGLNRGLMERGIGSRIIDGNVLPLLRREILDGFKNREFDVLITNPHTLGESVSLHTVCHDTIYYEYSYNLVHMLQSKDRIHRFGLDSNQYTQHRFLKTDYGGIMVNRGSDYSYSLDDEIYNRLKMKERQMIEAIESDRLDSSVCSSEDDIRLNLRDCMVTS